MAQSQPPAEETAPVDGPVHGDPALTQAVVALLDAARRDVRLFAPYLEPAVFHTSAVTGALSRFATQHTRNRVHILIEDVAQTLRDNSRLVDLARRLADAIELREVADDDRGERDLFLLADQSAFLILEDVGRSDGVVNTRAPQDAAQLRTRFDDAWERAVPVALRTLGL